MTDIETIEAAERPGRGRRKGQGDATPRRSAAWSPRAIIRAAKAAGYGRVSLDADGKITVEMGNPPVSKTGGDDGDKGEPNECDEILDRLEKQAKPDG